MVGYGQSKFSVISVACVIFVFVEVLDHLGVIHENVVVVKGVIVKVGLGEKSPGGFPSME